jgi:hypothetical protein
MDYDESYFSINMEEGDDDHKYFDLRDRLIDFYLKDNHISQEGRVDNKNDLLHPSS